MKQVNVGIDVSAKTLDVAIGIDKEVQQKVFGNNPVGHRELIKWITKKGRHAQVVFEATGSYGLLLALALDDHRRCTVMVANPMAIRNFGRAMMQRTKTDPIDACTILEFCKRMEFIPWKRPSDGAFRLRSICRRITQLKKEKTSEKCRSHCKDYEGATGKTVKQDIEANIKHLIRRIYLLEGRAYAVVKANPELKEKYDLLITIKGIAKTSALLILAELFVLPDGMKPSQWVAFAGLDPREKQSGSSVHSGKRISKAGSKYLRAALYFPAMSGATHDPNIKAFYRKLVDQRKKPKKVAQTAVMRKLLHAIWGMFRYNQPFDGGKFHPLPCTNAPAPITALRNCLPLPAP